MPTLQAKGRDDLVMATNNSSIVSKRSVERIYYSGEREYYRYFVKKFQRRAPLINRGYHLRLHLIGVMVHKFLCRPSSKAKVIVNLGCGSDVLPWQSMSRYPQHCEGVKFVDIDFPDVIIAKRNILKQSPELLEPLTNLEFPDHPRLLLKSDQYSQIACDLRQSSVIGEDIATLLDTTNSEFLFVAEVSITYMELASANALIRELALALLYAGDVSVRADTVEKTGLAQSERILPGGSSVPFAQTMLRHFEKLGTPLKCIHDYPTIDAQKKRFLSLGWPSAQCWSLWQAWKDPIFLSAAERCHLDTVEVFDEWEEFANFASHYFILHARNTAVECASADQISATDMRAPASEISLGFSPIEEHKNAGLRRFGAPLIVKNTLGDACLANLFGIGTDCRLPSLDIFSARGEQMTAGCDKLQGGGPTARTFLTLTDIGDAGYLLAGGRASPTSPFADSWVIKKDTYQWQRAQGLPLPLFRHSVTRLHDSQLAFLAGGKSSPSTIFSGYLLYHPSKGWLECKVDSSLRPPPLFGAVLICSGRVRGNFSAFHGILAGGMTVDNVVNNQAVTWTLDVSQIEEPTIRFESAADTLASRLLCRFGAVCATVDGWIVLAGGIDCRGSVQGEGEILRYRISEDGKEDARYLEYGRLLGPETPRPVLVGASIIGVENGEAAIIGGGMTCFSMGSIWSKGLYKFLVCPPDINAQASMTWSTSSDKWRYIKTGAISSNKPGMVMGLNAKARPAEIETVPRLNLKSEQQFLDILKGGKPVIFRRANLGSCISKWDADYLALQVGSSRKVVVHESSSQVMDFVSKNFSYKTQEFGDFVRDVGAGQKLYLRALSADQPSNLPARLDADFPTISGDFTLPPELAFATERLHSSVLRISGPVNMWLHYDVLANVYCQVQGSKRFFLFPPSDVMELGFGPGASSSNIDVFSALENSSLPGCHPYEADVGPSDILFIPPLWLHAASPLSTRSVAVNVFFRDLENGYSSGRDVYANRDLAAYEKARQDISKTLKMFKGLPLETRDFYIRRLADELVQKASE